MKKYIISFSIVIIIVFIFLFCNNEEKVILINSNSEQIIKSNTLTMMYETEADSGEYQVSSDTSWPQEGYTFNAELSRCENGSKLTWDEEDKKVLMQANTSDKCYVYFDLIPPMKFSDYIINHVYVEDGENGLYYHDGVGTYTNADQEAGDNSYRYAGANPNNYVCFGSDVIPCPADNLYRIIGVFDNQVKLIKSTSIGNYRWDYDIIVFDSTLSVIFENNNSINVSPLAIVEPGGSEEGSNNWATSDINYYINNEFFFDKLYISWQNMIADTAWQVGGNSLFIKDSTTKTVFNSEIINPINSNVYNAKIGLMYVSDYGYATTPNNWTISMREYNSASDSNWLYIGLDEWTITPRGDDDASVFNVSSGNIELSTNDENNNIRPTFYLNSDVVYVSGDGSQENPYRIA